ncbi:DeoR family transcriptional regulator [Allobaculum sp. Allo2]|uniref:DeoR family transcriptional regulator n=1 Tax=Allobaculum sp. Allo2 TaxID=2853432 RepID=UPI00346243E8|nr:DeoR family transcriptional regulator [Allobaculum sp. Allo2]
MMTEERHEKILEYLKGKERASQQELLDLLGTSESTLRRDLMALEEQGLLHRVRGGVTCKPRTHVSDSQLASRRDQHQKEKRRLPFRQPRRFRMAKPFIWMLEQRWKHSFLCWPERRSGRLPIPFPMPYG